MARFRGLTASLLLDLTYLTSIHDETSAKLGARRHDKKHRGAASTGHGPSAAGDKADGEQKENAVATNAVTSDLRVSHSLDEVKAHVAPNSKSEGEISSVAGGGAGGNESFFSTSAHAPCDGNRRKGHEHASRGHEPPPPSFSTQSEVHAVQLSYLYLGAMKTLSALLSCSKYAELLLIPKVLMTFILLRRRCCHVLNKRINDTVIWCWISFDLPPTSRCCQKQLPAATTRISMPARAEARWPPRPFARRRWSCGRRCSFSCATW